MSDVKTYQKIIENIYRQAVGAGVVNSKQDFANKIGVSPITMSKAMNGAEGYATKKMCDRIKAAFPMLDAEESTGQTTPAGGSPPQVVANPKQYSTLDNAIAAVNDAHGIIKTMQLQMNVLLDIIKKQI